MPNIFAEIAGGLSTLLAFDGTSFYNVLCDSDGHLQIDVLSSALPSGAATETTLDEVMDRLGDETNPASGTVNKQLSDAVTALQKIDDLQNALGSVDTDALQVRGEDQLFSVNSVLASHTSTTISGAGGYIDSSAVPTGYYWIVHTVTALDATTAPTYMAFYNRHDGINVCIHNELKAFLVNERSEWSGMTVLDVGDVVRVEFAGSLADDICYIDITGFVMTRES